MSVRISSGSDFSQRGISANILPKLTGLALLYILFAPGTLLCAQQSGAARGAGAPELDHLLREAQQALDRKDYAAAVPSLDAIVKLQPDMVPAWFNLAYAYTGLHRNDEAVEAYRKTLQLQPDLFDAQLNLGILLVEMQRAPEAAEHLEKAAALKPENHRAHLYAGRALSAAGKSEEAEQQYLAALILDASSAMTHFDLGQLYLDQKRFEPALQFFEKASELDPKLTQAQLGLALAAEGLKMPKEAVKHFEQYLAAQPGDAETRFHLAKLYLEEGENDQALASLEKVREAKPDLAGLAAALGDACALLKKFPDSEKYYRRALQETPRDSDLRRALGQTLIEEQNFSEAETEFRTALELDPRSREALKGLASSVYLQERYGEAIPLYEALAKAPESPGVFFLLATCYDHLQDRLKALENYERYLDLSHGRNPDQEWQAKHRAKLLRADLKK